MGSRILTHNLGYPRMGVLRQLKNHSRLTGKADRLEPVLTRQRPACRACTGGNKRKREST
jgi:hypothetical protein